MVNQRFDHAPKCRGHIGQDNRTVRHLERTVQITRQQIAASYEVAKQVFQSEIRPESGARVLNEQHDLNIASARDLIKNYQLMMRGFVFHRSMSAPATEYYLGRIAADAGIASLAHAISSVRKHIAYYESLRKTTLHKLRHVVDRLATQSQPPVDLEDHLANFTKSVEESLHGSSSARRKRLKSAAKSPQKILLTTSVFARNPDVVAEVLLRASGRCEACKKPAPFVKRSDGTPYLEVHHKKRLAKGGEDSVDNAIALCPNCHRQEHYG